MKLDPADGEVLWTDLSDGATHFDDSGWDIVVDPDGDPIVTGTYGAGEVGARFATYKLDAANGDHLWDVVLPGAVDNIAVRTGWLAVLDDGDVVMANRTWSGDSGTDVVLHRYAGSDGDIVWDTQYGSGGTVSDEPKDMVRDAGGDILVAGVTGNSYDYMVLKFSGASGDLIWDSTYVGPVFYDVASCIAEGPEGSVIVSGYSDGEGTGWDIATVGFNGTDGQQQWAVRYTGDVAYGSDEGRALAVGALGDIYVVGYSYNTDWNSDLLSLRYLLPTGAAGVTIPEPPHLIAAYPNPFNPRINLAFSLPEAASVRLIVRDVRGREVAILTDGVMAAGSHRASWDGRDQNGRPVAAGVYLATFETGGSSESRKIVLAK